MTHLFESEEKLEQFLRGKENWQEYVRDVRKSGDRFAIGKNMRDAEMLSKDDIYGIMRFLHCDFCGKETYVVGTHYGTSHYNRLICADCIKHVNNYHKSVDGWEKTLNDDGSYAN